MFVFTIRVLTKFKVAQNCGYSDKSGQHLKPKVRNCCGIGVLIRLLVFNCMYMYL